MEKKQLEMDARETRRRKILSRGSDRLAFITGQSQSLSEPDPPAHLLSDVGSLTGEGESSVSVENEANEPISGTEVESNIPKEAILSSRTGPVIETANEISRHEITYETIQAELRNSNNVTPRGTSTTIFKEISNIITASENSRMMCSVIIALFVVLSGFSPKFRPLVLVVVADLTIILGCILGNGTGESRIRLRDVGCVIVDTVKIIDGAILFKEAMDAIIMDCSLCALIMICAFPLQSS